MAFQTLKPSSGLVPWVLPPARATSVGSQSETCTSSRLTLPGRCSSGLATKATPRTPPSHSDHFLPRSGQLLPPANVWPPLSGEERERRRKSHSNKFKWAIVKKRTNEVSKGWARFEVGKTNCASRSISTRAEGSSAKILLENKHWSSPGMIPILLLDCSSKDILKEKREIIFALLKNKKDEGKTEEKKRFKSESKVEAGNKANVDVSLKVRMWIQPRQVHSVVLTIATRAKPLEGQTKKKIKGRL